VDSENAEVTKSTFTNYKDQETVLF